MPLLMAAGAAAAALEVLVQYHQQLRVELAALISGVKLALLAARREPMVLAVVVAAAETVLQLLQQRLAALAALAMNTPVMDRAAAVALVAGSPLRRLRIRLVRAATVAFMAAAAAAAERALITLVT